MPLILDNPCFLAREIASLLDSDPIACSQVKEYVPVNRLLDLFNLPPTETESVEEAMSCCSCSVEDFEDHFRETIIEQMDDAELIAEMLKRKMTKADILAALK